MPGDRELLKLALSFFFFFPRVRRRAIFLTFILKCNETQGKVDPGVIILYNIPDDSPQKSNFGC